MVIKKLALLLALSGALAACDQAPDPVTEDSSRKAEDVRVEKVPEQVNKELTAEQLKEMELSVRRMVKTPQADHVSQCKIVAMGEKPCGGPERYLMYSTKTMSDSEEQNFLQKLAQYNRMQQQFNMERGMMSDCQMIPEPGVMVKDGFCMPIERSTM